MRHISVFFLFCFLSCTSVPTAYWEPYDETLEVEASQTHENPRMRFKLIQSKLLDKNELWAPFEKALQRFGEEGYLKLKPLVLEHDIPSLQGHIASGALSYDEAHFLETYHFLNELDVSYFHVFTYSERPNTPAAQLTGVVDQKTRHKRSKLLRGLSAKKRYAFYQSQLGISNCGNSKTVLSP